MPNTVEDTVDELFDVMSFETVLGWANILNVEHDEDTWRDDEWPDKEGELRFKQLQRY